MNTPRHDFPACQITGLSRDEISDIQSGEYTGQLPFGHDYQNCEDLISRERSNRKSVGRWLVTIMGLLFAYSVFVFIALGGW